MIYTKKFKYTLAVLRFLNHIVDLVVALIGICTLGLWVPGWEMGFRIWTSKKILKKRMSLCQK